MRDAHPLFHPDRPFLVYLTDYLNKSAHPGSDMPRMYWEGLQAESIEQNADLLAVMGGGNQSGAFLSVVNDLIRPDMADGFISWTPYSGGHIEQVLPRLDASPMVCLGTAFSAHPTINVSNASGIRTLVKHLYHQHGCRKIAFIKGAVGNVYSIERFDSYCDTLEELGLVFDPQLVTDFGPLDTQGKAGIECLLDERGLQIGRDIDAIMCSADRIALGAYDALACRGIVVPRDVALTGYDNVLAAQCHIPSITSVYAPLYSVARYAQRVLLGWVNSQRQPEMPKPLHSVAVIADSCGCKNHRLHRMEQVQAAIPIQDIEAFKMCLVDALYQFRFPPALPHEMAQAMLDVFVESLRSRCVDPLSDWLKRKIRTSTCEAADQLQWQDLLNLFKQHEAIFTVETTQSAYIDMLLAQARLAIVEGFSSAQTDAALRDAGHLAALRKLSSALSFTDAVPDIMNELAQAIPQMGIPAVWLSVFDSVVDAQKFVVPSRARLILAVEDGVRAALPVDGMCFDSQHLLPSGVVRSARRKTLMLYPLMHAGDEYGFMIFEQGAVEGRVYEELVDLIGSALKNAFLREELEKRTVDLELSIYDLGRARNKLVESEKLAALGELVAGIAHEINTPIGIGVTAISTLADNVSVLKNAVEQRNVREVRQATMNLSEGADIALRNLRRANELIESFKQIAVDQTYEECREFELGAYIGDIVRSLEPRLRQGHYIVKLDCPAVLMLTSYPGAVAQIMSNIILNSLIHGFEVSKEGEIQIACYAHNGAVIIDYQDNGMGMDASTLEKMFHPFFTTKRGRGGTGLGMHIVYNLVMQKLGGTIECESSPGLGVKIKICIPT